MSAPGLEIGSVREQKKLDAGFEPANPMGLNPKSSAFDRFANPTCMHKHANVHNIIIWDKTKQKKGGGSEWDPTQQPPETFLANQSY